MKHKLSFGCRSKCPQQEAEGSSVAPWWHHKQKPLLWLHSQRTLRTDCAAAESSEPRSTRTAHSGRAASSDWPRFNGQCTKWQQQSLQLVSRREKHASALGQGLHRSSALSAGHIVRVRHSSLLWKLAGEFNQKVTFHQDFFFPHQKMPVWVESLGFLLVCVAGNVDFAGTFLRKGVFISE